MSFPNVYTHRKVAEGSAKGCEICYKPSTSVLITPENKAGRFGRPECSIQDFFYICPSHLRDRGFCTPIVDKAAEEAKKKKAAEEKEAEIKAEMERVKKEYEEKQKKKNDKKEKKDEKDKKDKEDKKDDKEKEKDEKDKADDKDKDSKDDKDKEEKEETPASDQPRVFALNRLFTTLHAARCTRRSAAYTPIRLHAMVDAPKLNMQQM
ncbi:hypothetical protein SPBR_06002 [Sporothrix brasiliensis 5110]|uniref:Uncharacterized protein n=1 Tax=Sporothrix brasiliensis 5110 TaxID=1398154 RepID=A0A0C2F5S6_9PEZI|nr:uncharacterized protein SPBR_06002 [Sporothrix brasiliensis 5110]KIH94254.1 hypothetical protein SPBR_06002 [Sporothrix brasiliensis 5110]